MALAALARRDGGSVRMLLALLVLCTAARPAARNPGYATAVLAGGCFWGVEEVFEHTRGVRSATSGYTDGVIEAVRVVYDTTQVSYRELLQVFFTIAHDPTSRDHQGPDVGPEYRAVVYYLDAAQEAAARAMVAELTAAHRFSRPIVTEIRALKSFREAEAFHQDYALRHPGDPYIVINDLPKLERLRREFPRLYREQRAAAN
jgi:peptide-methionine (S)-S-oxide reductase